jgi:predicted TIM-barrel fold metal-dependent hydrolase
MRLVHRHLAAQRLGRKVSVRSTIDDVRVIDADTHVIEPYDLWTSRVSVKKWGEQVPHVRWDSELQEEAWYFGDRRICAAAAEAMAGWPEYAPDRPRRLEDVEPATWDAGKRLSLMDDYGIYAQILYPNVSGFGAGRYLGLKTPELSLECVRAYNDYLTDWSGASPERYVPISALPLWDVDEAIRELERCAAMGHKGILMSSQLEQWGLPHISDRQWDPVWSAAQECGLPVNFHVASGDAVAEMATLPLAPENGKHANWASINLPFIIGNARAISHLICSGICHRFPELNFVSVESGVGWIPFALGNIEWSWKNSGVAKEHPEYDLLPSEYFARQIYACFWYETDTVKSAIEFLGPDNLLYETDFPHPTSMSPGPASIAMKPRDFIESNFGDLPQATFNKLFHDNAAKIYGLR